MSFEAQDVISCVSNALSQFVSDSKKNLDYRKKSSNQTASFSWNYTGTFARSIKTNSQVLLAYQLI